MVVFDIGGGSTELIGLDLSERARRGPLGIQNHVMAWTSLPIGVVTLAERFGGVDVTPNQFEAMVDFVRGELQDFFTRPAVATALQGGGIHLLGTSGTVTTICGVHLGLERYDRRRVDGVWRRTRGRSRRRQGEREARQDPPL